MNRRQWMIFSGAAAALGSESAQSQQAPPAEMPANTPDRILLKDYRPKSIYKIPRTEIQKAKFPAIDVHCHGARPIEQLGAMVTLMDAAGIEKTVVFTGTAAPERFAELRQVYSKYPNRFELWCSFDLSGADQPGFGPAAVKTLEECHRLGALGVGEISDKGWGFSTRPPGGRSGTRSGGPGPRSTAPPSRGPHADDPRMDDLWDKCAQLGMAVNIHVSDPIWAYEPMDNTNDGLMNGYTWRIDDKQPGIFGHNALLETLERALARHRKTVFIACHLANLDYDLTRLGRMFETHPNLYADISARFAETAPIPRFVNRFFQKYPDRILYGTDMGYTQRMFSATFRILETADEHLYERDLNFNFDYHWPLHGFALPDPILKRVYRDNALQAFRQARAGAA